MKRMMSIIVSALVAVSFAGIVWAAETSTEGTRSTSDEPRANMPSATSTDTLGTTRKDTGETKRKKKRSTKKKSLGFTKKTFSKKTFSKPLMNGRNRWRSRRINFCSKALRR